MDEEAGRLNDEGQEPLEGEASNDALGRVEDVPELQYGYQAPSVSEQLAEWAAHDSATDSGYHALRLPDADSEVGTDGRDQLDAWSGTWSSAPEGVDPQVPTPSMDAGVGPVGDDANDVGDPQPGDWPSTPEGFGAGPTATVTGDGAPPSAGSDVRGPWDRGWSLGPRPSLLSKLLRQPLVLGVGLAFLAIFLMPLLASVVVSLLPSGDAASDFEPQPEPSLGAVTLTLQDCAAAIKPSVGPLDALVAQPDLPEVGTGAIGERRWAIDVPYAQTESIADNTVMVLGATPATVVVGRAGANSAELVVGAYSLSEGTKRWSVRFDQQEAPNPETFVAEDQLWVPLGDIGSGGSTRALVGIDLNSGGVSTCLAYDRESSGIGVAGTAAYALQRAVGSAGRRGEGFVSRLGPSGATWRVALPIGTGVILGGNDDVVVVGGKMSRGSARADAEVFGLDAATGAVRWRAPMTDLTTGMTSYDGSPVPERARSGFEAVGIIRTRSPLFAVMVQPGVTQRVGDQTLVSFIWSPASAAVGDASSAYAVTLDAATGGLAYGGYLGTPFDSPIAAGDGATYVVPRRGSALRLSGAGATAIPEVNQDLQNNVAASGARLVQADFDFATLTDSVNLVAVGQGIVGSLDITLEDRSGMVLTDKTWVGVAEAGPGRFQLVAYTLAPPSAS